MPKKDIGIIGMAVMGRNLALNIEDKGFSVAVYNRTKSKTEEFVREKASGKNITATYSLEDFVNSLRRPRRILLMVKAGAPVEGLLERIFPLLGKGDIIMDGGNSHFQDTERRCQEAEKRGFLYLGVGISGGEYGALHGPCIMPGGSKEAYRQVEEIFIRICAQTEDGACCTYLGPGSAGHYVKMVHNGIEYAIMQIIAECYHIMREGLNMEIEKIKDVFEKWNLTELNSYLIQITAEILDKKDQFTGKALIDVILDKAEQKGTGRWAVQSALDLGVPVPAIFAAVDARIISSFKSWRMLLAEKFKNERKEKITRDKESFLSRLREACYMGMLISYTQGMHLLRVASREYSYSLDLSEVARIWKGGCIIRARLLDLIKSIYQTHPDLPNLLLSEKLEEQFKRFIPSLREVIIEAKKCKISLPVMESCLNYYESFKTPYLPANLIQAQRDFFGAHTYKRVDKEGDFHTVWQEEEV